MRFDVVDLPEIRRTDALLPEKRNRHLLEVGPENGFAGGSERAVGFDIDVLLFEVRVAVQGLEKFGPGRVRKLGAGGVGQRALPLAVKIV